MLRTSLKTAFRNLQRNKGFSSINIAGLALGLASFILIMLWVQYEMNYDGYHRDKSRIAEIMTNRKLEGGEIQTFPAVPSPLAAAIEKDVPAVEFAAAVSWGDARQFTVGEKNFVENGLYVSPDFLKIFTFPLVRGNEATALRQPNTVLITEKLARKYFGDEDPVGRTVMVEQRISYQVAGVLKDVPGHSTFHFDFLMPMQDYVNYSMDGKETWEYGNVRSYVKLRQGVDLDKFGKDFAGMLAKYTDKQPQSTLMLWGLSDWYLRFDFKNGKYAGGGRITYVRLFTIVGFFILLLACINFMNLSTARAAQRAREVGVRKVIGAGRSRLIRQFLAESMLLTVAAGIIAVVTVTLLLPAFNTFFSKQIAIDLSDTTNIAYFGIIILVTGLLAGSYPAFVLSSFRPVRVLKDARTPASGLSWIRRGLVVTQFAVSVALIIGTVIVSRQVHYLQDRDLGFNKEHLVWFPNNVTIDRNEAFIQELKSVPGVLSASLTSTTFTASNNRGTEVSWPGKLPGQDVFFNFFATSNDIVNTLGLTVKEGRAFSGSFLADTSSVLVNEEAVRKMGLKDPVGQVLDMYSGKATIVGVVKDFHFESLHHPVTPAIFLCRPNWTWNVYVRTDGRDLAATLSGMEKKYKAMAPGFVFDYNFQDKEYERLYRSESQVGTLVNWFAFLAVFISCLGLLGLTAYTVERRKKEIGVRKVLGASSITILAMVSRQFIGLIIIAVVIASVPAYIIMNNWLGNYAYHVELSWWIFLVAGLAAMLLALVTISIQAGRAARMNPVRSLRTE